MIKKILGSIKGCRDKIASPRKNKLDKERKILEKKVEEGTDLAIREYGEVFKKLAEYDRS